MDVLLDVLLIALITVNITDISGIVQHIEDSLSRWLKLRSVHIKILECSYCQTHWLGLLYLLISGNLTLFNYAMLLIVCLMTPVMYSMLILIREGLNKVVALISEKVL